jgi:hypothetical protein
LPDKAFLVFAREGEVKGNVMDTMQHHLGAALARRLAALAEQTDQDVDDLLKEAVSTYLDAQEQACVPSMGFKELLRSWSLEDLDLEREGGEDRADLECE